MLRRALATAPLALRAAARAPQTAPLAVAPLAARAHAAGAAAAAAAALGLFSVAACAAEPQQDPAAHAEALYQDGTQPRQAVLDFLMGAFAADSRDPELAWRLARAKYDVAQLSGCSKEDNKRLTYEAFELIELALRNGDDNFAVHKWFGILLNAKGSLEGTKASIGNSFVVREHWQRAVELNPRDATSHHLLGRWCFEIANISWLERKVASALFGTPPVATVEEALAHFQRAEALDPGFWTKNMLQIALCHKRLGDKDQAREWAAKAAANAVVSEEDQQSHDEAEALLKALG